MQTGAENDTIFRDAETAMNKFFDTVDHSQYRPTKDEINAGLRLFRRFLNYCDDLGIINGYYEERVATIFQEYKPVKQEKKCVKLKLIKGGGNTGNGGGRAYE